VSTQPDLPFAHGGPPLTGSLRAAPEDFFVEEDLGFAADGAGEHCLVRVEKRGANTEWVARELSRFAGVGRNAVSYAGMKDRNAVTRQSFSIHLPGRADPAWQELRHDEFHVLDAARHSRKLRPGALRGNAFRIVLRDVAGDRMAFESRLAAVAQSGVPNYFGAQRFGHGGDNVERARAMFAGRRVQRHERSVLLSAARSFLFNEVLAERVRQGTWNCALDGEVWMLSGTRSIFGPEPVSADLEARLDAGDILPTGPMFGEGALRSQAMVAGIETDIAGRHPDLVEGLAKNGLRQERRALVLRPDNLVASWQSDTAVELRFDLRKGSYATVIIREMLSAVLPEEQSD
jgi:tRNA pseudouridine13 synthase